MPRPYLVATRGIEDFLSRSGCLRIANARHSETGEVLGIFAKEVSSEADVRISTEMSSHNVHQRNSLLVQVLADNRME